MRPDRSLPLLRRIAQQQQARVRTIALLGGGAAIVAGGSVVYAALALLDELHDSWLLIGGIAMAIVGVLWIALSWRGHRVLTALARRGVAPVKAYISEVETIGAANRRRLSLVIELSDGDRAELGLGLATHRRLDDTVRGLVRELAHAYPTVLVGWSTKAATREATRSSRADVKLLAELRAIEEQRSYRNGHLRR